MPTSVRALLVAAIAAGTVVVVACAATLAGDPVERQGLVAVLAVGMLLAELFPIRVPGREEEISFSTSFTFALIVTHGTAEAVLVATGTLLLADVLRRRAPIKIAYNASQYAISWAVAGVIYELIAGSPGSNVVTVGPPELLGLLVSGLAYGVVNGMLAPLPPALLGGGLLWPQLRHGIEFVVGTTIALVALAPIVVVVAGRDLWLVPLLGVPLAAIQLGTRQALINEAHARIDAVSGALTRGELERELGRRLAAKELEPAVVVVDIVGVRRRQRRARLPRRRRRARDGGRAAGRRRRARRSRRAHRRRRVRGAVRGVAGRRGGRAGRGGARAAGLARRAGRRRARGARRGVGARAGRADAAARGRRRAAGGEGARAALGALRAGDERGRRRAARARAGAATGDRRGRARPALPAEGRPAHRCARRLRGARALAPPRPRPRPAGRVHRPRRADRADPAADVVGARRRDRRPGAMGGRRAARAGGGEPVCARAPPRPGRTRSPRCSAAARSSWR